MGEKTGGDNNLHFNLHVHVYRLLTMRFCLWSFYLLAVVQSLWLDLSHSSSDSEGSLSSSLLSDKGLEILREREFQNERYLELKDRLRKIEVEESIQEKFFNEVWEKLTLSSSFKESSQKNIMSEVLAEIESLSESKLERESSHVLDGNNLNMKKVDDNNNNKCLEFVGRKGLLELCISTPSCADISVKEFPSKYKPPTSIELNVSDLSLACEADWYLSYTIQPWNKLPPRKLEYEGTVGFSFSHFQTSLLMNLLPETSSEMNEILIPSAFRFENCIIDDSIFKFDVFFSGGLMGLILDKTLAPALSEGVENSIYWLFCDIVAPVLGRAFSRLLVAEIDPRIENIMAKGVEPPPVQLSGYFSWQTSLFNSIHKLIDFVQVNEAELLKCVVNSNVIQHLEQGDDVERSKIEAFLHKVFSNLPLENIPLSGISNVMKGVGVSVDMLHVSINGLNTSNLKILYPSSESNVTLLTSASFSSIDIDFLIRLTQNVNGTNVQNRDIRLALRLTDLDIIIDAVVGLRISVIDDLYLDEAIQIPCLLSALEEFYISSLLMDVNVSRMTITVIDSFLDSQVTYDFNMFINNLIELITDGYSSMTSQIIKGIMQGPVRNSLNEKIAEAMAEFYDNHPDFVCKDHIPSNVTTSNWIEWPESLLVEGLNKVVNDYIGPSGVNSLLSCLTKDRNDLLIQMPLSSPVLAGWNITISGLNSFYEFALLSTKSQFPFDLLTDVAVGGNCAFNEANIDSNVMPDLKTRNAVPCIPLNVTFTGYEHNGNYVDVKVSVKNVQLLLDILLEIDRGVMSNMQVSEFNTPGCRANAVDLCQIANWSLHALNVEFFFIEETEEVSITTLANNVFDVVMSSSNQESLNSLLRKNILAARDLCEAGGVTPSSDVDDHQRNQMQSMFHFFRHTWKWKVAVLIAGTVLSFCMLLRLFIRMGMELDKTVGNYNLHTDLPTENSCSGLSNPNMKLHDLPDVKLQPSGNFLSNNWIHFHLKSVSSKLFCFDSMQEGDNDAEYDSLLGNENLSLYSRLSVVIFIGIIMFIFVISEIPSSPAALVLLEVDFGSHTSSPATVYKFGLAVTVREMWEAGVYYLAVLIAFFTGGWPYVKMAVMLLAWILPSSVLSIEWRNWLLVWLDLLGKWSLVDSFVMMVMMVSFHISFDIMPGVVVRITVNPQWGFYAFLLATAASLAMGHYVLACHRFCCVIAENEIEEKILHSEEVKIVSQNDSFKVVHKFEKPLEDECLDANSVDEPLPNDDGVVLYSLWNGKKIDGGDEKGTCESLMDHVFVMHVAKNKSSFEVRSESGESGCDEEELIAPFVGRHSPPIVNLSDLAEWSFQPAEVSDYFLSIRFTDLGKMCLVALFAISTLIVLGGTLVKVIQFDFVGLTGYLMDDDVSSYSLVDIGVSIPAASGEPHRFGVLFIQIIYFIFGIFLPIVFFAALGVLFVLPLSLANLRGVVVLTEVLNAWAALDVLVVSGVASVLEIRRFAQFMLGEGCGELNKILEETMDDELEGHDKCFDVIASMKDVSCHDT